MILEIKKNKHQLKLRVLANCIFNTKYHHYYFVTDLKPAGEFNLIKTNQVKETDQLFTINNFPLNLTNTKQFSDIESEKIKEFYNVKRSVDWKSSALTDNFLFRHFESPINTKKSIYFQSEASLEIYLNTEFFFKKKVPGYTTSKFLPKINLKFTLFHNFDVSSFIILHSSFSELERKMHLHFPESNLISVINTEIFR